MPHVGLSLFAFLLSLFNSFTKEIPGAFLGNDARALRAYFAPGSYIQISLPAPFNFSDQVSAEQAYLLFGRIFASAKTSGFYPEGDILPTVSRGSFIYKARWEFLTTGRSPGAFRILFYVRGRPASRPGRGLWRITEIRADRVGTGDP
ncbi:MAG: hypothetical protein FJY80_00675 [Candidatus Aminicenantes bacterium]|nr:hypothetical protein [Candidatus Aminicenantes bacterium]